MITELFLQEFPTLSSHRLSGAKAAPANANANAHTHTHAAKWHTLPVKRGLVFGLLLRWSD